MSKSKAEIIKLFIRKHPDCTDAEISKSIGIPTWVIAELRKEDNREEE